MLESQTGPPHDRKSFKCSDCPSIPRLTPTLRKFRGGGVQSRDIFRGGGQLKKSPCIKTNVGTRFSATHIHIKPSLQWWFYVHMCSRKMCFNISFDRQLSTVAWKRTKNVVFKDVCMCNAKKHHWCFFLCFFAPFLNGFPIFSLRSLLGPYSYTHIAHRSPKLTH